jgi:DNA invertase Pin-like site-specific DNA recombinase
MIDNYRPEAYTLPAEIAGKSRAIIYCRVGQKKDAGKSKSSFQYDCCFGFARRAGLEVVAHYEDVGTYGSTGLPQLDAAIREVERGRADVLLVEDFDRLNRDVRQDLLVKARVEAAGGVLIIADIYRTGSVAQQISQDIAAMLGTYKQVALDGRA